MILNRKIRRTILENKSRYFGAFLLVFFSCMLYISFTICGPGIKESVDQFRKDSEMEDANFILQKPIAHIGEIESKFNVVLEERLFRDYQYDKDSTLRVFSETRKVNKYQVIEGRRIENSSEIVMDMKFAKAHELSLNSKFEMDGKKYTLVGYIALPDYLYVLKAENELINNPHAFGFAVVSAKAFESFSKGSLNYLVKFNKDNLDEFKNYLNDNYIVIKWLSKEENTRISAFNGDITAFIEAGKVIPVAILVLTCMLIAVVLWRLLKGEFVQIGTLYALGYRKKEILKHYLAYAVMISLAGSVTGTAAGIFLARPLVVVQEIQYSLPIIHFNYNVIGFLMSLMLPFLFLVPSTFLVVRKALAMPPLLLIRGGGSKVKVGFLEKRLNLNRFKFATKFKIREIVRNIPRAILMVLGVSLASMLLLFGFVTNDSINSTVYDSYEKIYKYDYAYIFNTMKFEKPVDFEKMSSMLFTTKVGDKKEEAFTINGIQKDAKLVELRDAKGNKISFDRVIITKPLAKKLGLKEKDLLKVKSKLSSKEFSLTIDKIAEAYIGDYIYMPLEQFNRHCGFPEDGYLGILSNKEMKFDPNMLIAKLDKQEILKGFKNMVEPMQIMVLIVGIISFIIGLIIIYVVTSMVIEENRANISLLKILGYSKKKIYSLVLNSNTVLVVIGYALSVPIIIMAVGKFFDMITSQMDMSILPKLQGISIVLGFVIIFTTYEISKLLSRRLIIGISMADSLKARVE
ncbi:MAG: ABC transporter permease [Clostridia bacterium]|nr:ABC transporter permease [Clostridia bacterium]